MKECNQTRDFTVFLFGKTLPKYILYGKVCGKVFTCDFFAGKLETPDNVSRYVIRVYDTKRNKWVTTDTSKYPKILDAIKKYADENTILGTAIELCEHKTKRSRNEFYGNIRKTRRAEKAHFEFLRDSGAPQMRSIKISASGAAKHTFMNEGGRVETEKVWIDEKNPKPIPADYWESGYLQPFEMGQTTSGTVNGAYTRSGFEVKRDGLKIDPTKIRPNDKPDYMRKSGQPRSLSEAQQIALLKNKGEVWYNHNHAKSEGIKSLKQCAIKED